MAIVLDVLRPVRHLVAATRLAQCAVCISYNAWRVERAQNSMRHALDAYERARADLLQHELGPHDEPAAAVKWVQR